MKKIILVLFFIGTTVIMINSTTITQNILLSFNICFNNLFPSLIPFILLSNIFIKYDFIKELAEIFKFITEKIFKINKNCAFALVFSIISGSPSNAKYLKDLYANNLINLYDIKKCINFCHFVNPIFVLSTVGVTFFNNKKIGIIILISNILGSFFIGFVFKKKKNTRNSIVLETKNDKKFITILNESIINTANILLLILGIITFCLIITGIIDVFFSINRNYKFIYGLLEITQGLKYLSYSNLNISIKASIASFIISFGGLCIHLQVFSILDNKQIRYLPYLFSRILHALVSSLITFIMLIY